MTPSACSICGTESDSASDRCATCGAPTDDRARQGAKSACRHCSAVLWSGAETCPSCRERGYPALGPRFGGKSRRSPDWEETHSEPG